MLRCCLDNLNMVVYAYLIRYIKLGISKMINTSGKSVIKHPQLGRLVWSIWEYPAGTESNRETDVGSHE